MKSEGILKLLKWLLQLFCGIVTAQVIYLMILSLGFGLTFEINAQTLYSIVVTAFLSILPTAALSIVMSKAESVSRGVFFLLRSLHFISTLVLVILSLNFFGGLHHERFIHIIVVFFVIYIIVNIITELHNKKAMEELNKRINATHQP